MISAGHSRSSRPRRAATTCSRSPRDPGPRTGGTVHPKLAISSRRRPATMSGCSPPPCSDASPRRGHGPRARSRATRPQTAVRDPGFESRAPFDPRSGPCWRRRGPSLGVRVQGSTQRRRQLGGVGEFGFRLVIGQWLARVVGPRSGIGAVAGAPARRLRHGPPRALGIATRDRGEADAVSGGDHAHGQAVVVAALDDLASLARVEANPETGRHAMVKLDPRVRRDVPNACEQAVELVEQPLR